MFDCQNGIACVVQISPFSPPSPSPRAHTRIHHTRVHSHMSTRKTIHNHTHANTIHRYAHNTYIITYTLTCTHATRRHTHTHHIHNHAHTLTQAHSTQRHTHHRHYHTHKHTYIHHTHATHTPYTYTLTCTHTSHTGTQTIYIITRTCMHIHITPHTHHTRPDGSRQGRSQCNHAEVEWVVDMLQALMSLFPLRTLMRRAWSVGWLCRLVGCMCGWVGKWVVE